MNPAFIVAAIRRFVAGGSVLAALSLMSLASTGEAKEASWTSSSPNNTCAISLHLETDGTLAYEVTRADRPVLARSPLGLRRDDQDFLRGLVFNKAGNTETRREIYELFTGPKSQVDNPVNRRTISFRNAEGAPLDVDLAASEEGVAFRYRFPDASANLRVIEEELTGFNVPAGTRGWLQPYHAAGPYTPAYEDFYFHVAPGETPPESRGKPLGWCFPALFAVPSHPETSGAGTNTWLLITESGTGPEYCGCHLSAESRNGHYRIAFPAANEFTKGQTNNLSPSPRFNLPWVMPWRVLVIGAKPSDIAISTLVTDLAPPARITDTSWIKPGRASWAWWSYPDGPNSTNIFNQFTDFAHGIGWEYTLLDAGWWEPGLKTLTQHARAREVQPLAWCFAGDFYAPVKRKRKLDEMTAAGVAGVKVDFWCSDRQEAIAAIHQLFADAADRKLVVNLHGCTLPRGWQRTWPHLLTAEAVLGTESYFYEPRYTKLSPELNTVLPFTRNAVGPMDYTPVACSPKKYERRTTAAHELATAIVFTSGLIHFADKPEFFEGLPAEARQLLRDAPARWDESRCLAGEPGRFAVFARRSGKEWFLAGISAAETPIPLDLDLTSFKAPAKQVLVREHPNDPRMKVTCEALSLTPRFRHTLPPRGGFILRMGN